MWIPKDEAEIVSATSNKSLAETDIFDAKKEIPNKNVETAKDISAMANTNGGVIIYGIEEDSDKIPSIPNPILLSGQRERIDQIVRTSVSEVPYYSITSIPTSNDPSLGYIVVKIPPSERAPHMVVVKNEKRFYGRGETGNYILSEKEVARLYERRVTSESNIMSILEEFISQCPIELDSNFAHLHLVARPVLSHEELLTKVITKEHEIPNLLNELLNEVVKSGIFEDQYVPNFRQSSNWIRRPEGFFTKLSYANRNDPRQSAEALNLQVNLDGSASLFCGRAAERSHQDNSIKYFFSSIVAGNTIKFLSLLGRLYDKASYFGAVDIGLAIIGLEDCYDYESRNHFYNEYRFDRADYKKSIRRSAMLLMENAYKPSESLLMPIIEAISQGRGRNPFKSES